MNLWGESLLFQVPRGVYCSCVRLEIGQECETLVILCIFQYVSHWWLKFHEHWNLFFLVLLQPCRWNMSLLFAHLLGSINMAYCGSLIFCLWCFHMCISVILIWGGNIGIWAFFKIETVCMLKRSICGGFVSFPSKNFNYTIKPQKFGWC